MNCHSTSVILTCSLDLLFHFVLQQIMENFHRNFCVMAHTANNTSFQSTLFDSAIPEIHFVTSNVSRSRGKREEKKGARFQGSPIAAPKPALMSFGISPIPRRPHSLSPLVQFHTLHDNPAPTASMTPHWKSGLDPYRFAIVVRRT